LAPAGERADLLHWVCYPRRALARLDVDRLGLGMLLERPLDRRGIDGTAPLDLELDRLDAVRLADLAPALAELAAVDADRLVALLEEVGDGPLHRAGPAGGEDEDVVLGLEDPPEPFAHLGEELFERRRAVVQDRLRHRQCDP